MVEAPPLDIGLAFVTRLSKHLARAEMPPFNLDHYAGQVPVGKVLGTLPSPWDKAAVDNAIASSWQATTPQPPTASQAVGVQLP
jgi:hypothetical protein